MILLITDIDICKREIKVYIDEEQKKLHYIAYREDVKETCISTFTFERIKKTLEWEQTVCPDGRSVAIFAPYWKIYQQHSSKNFQQVSRQTMENDLLNYRRYLDIK